MIILPSCWIMPKECTSLPMNAEENIPTRFMMPASSTSSYYYYHFVSFYLQQIRLVFNEFLSKALNFQVMEWL